MNFSFPAGSALPEVVLPPVLFVKSRGLYHKSSGLTHSVLGGATPIQASLQRRRGSVGIGNTSGMYRAMTVTSPATPLGNNGNERPWKK